LSDREPLIVDGGEPVITNKRPDRAQSPPQAGPSAWPRIVFLAVSAAVAVGVIVVAHEVMLPFVLAAVIAYVLTPAVAWVERKKVPRAAAIVLVYVAVLGSIGLFVRGAAPRIGQELGNLRKELPTLAGQVKTDLIPAIQERLRALGIAPAHAPPPEPPSDEPSLVVKPRPDGSYAIEVGSGLAVYPTREGGYTVEPIREEKVEPFDPNKILSDAVGKSFAYAQRNALELARIGRDIVAGVSRVIFIFGITLMLAAYMMLTREKIQGFFTSLVRPSARPSFALLLWRIDKGLSGVVRGQLIICLVNGVLSAIGFAIVGLKYWPVLALVATVLSLIPIFGSIISSIPAVALGLTQSFGTAVFVLVWIIGIHQLEANFLNPKIMGDQAKIHPVLVIFSLLVGEHFFHTVGALLAVPCMSIAQSVFVHFRHVVQTRDPEMAGEPVASMPPPGVVEKRKT
jgi:predicted PurR-regulated permease PerM